MVKWWQVFVLGVVVFLAGIAGYLVYSRLFVRQSCSITLADNSQVVDIGLADPDAFLAYARRFFPCTNGQMAAFISTESDAPIAIDWILFQFEDGLIDGLNTTWDDGSGYRWSYTLDTDRGQTGLIIRIDPSGLAGVADPLDRYSRLIIRFLADFFVNQLGKDWDEYLCIYFSGVPLAESGLKNGSRNGDLDSFV